MRTSIKIFCASVIAAICLLVWFSHTTKPQANTSPQSENTLTNQPTRSEPPKAVENRQTSNVARTTTAPSVAISRHATRRDTNAMVAQALAVWQGSIEFYGKVVDENSNAVAGATASFDWVETPTEEGNRRTNTESDLEGLFSLHGQLGLNLGVSVSKVGYYNSRRDNDSFNYGALRGESFSPDPRNPVIFHLRKKGIGENLIGVKQNYRVARDGTPLGINLTTGKTTTGGSGDFVVRCWTDDQGKRSGPKYDWRCLVTIPGGGMVPTDEEFPFVAPEDGYTLTNEIAMPTGRTNWTSQVDLKLYFRLADGRYGRMKFSMIAGGQHFCMIDSVLNPSGSRNLEPQ